jgi:hypothetical protein
MGFVVRCAVADCMWCGVLGRRPVEADDRRRSYLDLLHPPQLFHHKHNRDDAYMRDCRATMLLYVLMRKSYRQSASRRGVSHEPTRILSHNYR